MASYKQMSDERL